MSDLQREKFEDWAATEFLNITKYGAAGVYCYPEAHLAWTAWQAAIASVVVELPEPHEDEWKELNLSTDEVVKALGDAGVKYVLPETFVRY